MNLTFISDPHFNHYQIELGCGDILFVCGDFTRKGRVDDVVEFSKFIGAQNFRYKVVIAGNHDFCFEDERREEVEKILSDNGIVYLNDSGIEIEGIHIWGSPIQPWFFDWAFNRRRGEKIRKHWDLIPENTDILITHGPPMGILDVCKSGKHVGCEDLLLRLEKVAPKIHAFGHIHESYGIEKIKETTYINCSISDERYQYKNGPISLTYPLD